MSPVISFRNVRKGFGHGSMRSEVLNIGRADIPRGRSIALLGRNGAGKSTLLGLASGAIKPDRGRIERRGRVSWPVGFGGNFHPDLTGRQNVAFAARLYGVRPETLVERAADMAEIGPAMERPVGQYSSGMRARLAFCVSLAMRFDLYLVDEVLAVGDARFRRISGQILRDRIARAGAIVVSHSMAQLREVCDAAMIIEGGRLHWFDDVETAIARHLREVGT